MIPLFKLCVCVRVCAISLAGYVEALASRLGMQVPDLTPKQADMWQTRLSSHMVSNSVAQAAVLLF